jgi:hypothetical protein
VIFVGILRKTGDLVWCFCGVIVVNCVANVVLLHHIFERQKMRQIFQSFFYFLMFQDILVGATCGLCHAICLRRVKER